MDPREAKGHSLVETFLSQYVFNVDGMLPVQDSRLNEAYKLL
jgi:hypothetical protein